MPGHTSMILFVLVLGYTLSTGMALGECLAPGKNPKRTILLLLIGGPVACIYCLMYVTCEIYTTLREGRRGS